MNERLVMRRRWYCLPICLVVATMSPAAHGEELATQEAIAKLSKAIDAIYSYDVRLTVTKRWLYHREVIGMQDFGPEKNVPIFQVRRLRPDERPTAESQTWRHIWLRGRRRVESGFNLETTKPTAVTVSDGTIMRTLISSDAAASIAFDTDRWPIAHGDYRSCFATERDRFPLLRILTERGGTQLNPKSTSAGQIVLEVPPAPEPSQVFLGRFGYRIWLDSRRGCLPVKIEVFELLDGTREALLERMLVERFKEIGEGVWAPIEVYSKSFSTHGTLAGEATMEVSQVVEVEKSQWNIAIPEATFALDFPIGTRVKDHTRKLAYTIGNESSAVSFPN